VGRVVEPAPLAVAADLDRGQPAQVHHQAVPGRVAGEAVRAASSDQPPAALTGEVDDLAHVRGARHLDYGSGPRIVIAAVPDQSRCPIGGSVRNDDGALERGGQLLYARGLGPPRRAWVSCAVSRPPPATAAPSEAPCLRNSRRSIRFVIGVNAPMRLEESPILWLLPGRPSRLTRATSLRTAADSVRPSRRSEAHTAARAGSLR
jgi:hypothetical protein